MQGKYDVPFLVLREGQTPRMYGRSLKLVLSLPLAARPTFFERLDRLRPRAKHLGWGVQDELNDLWYEADRGCAWMLVAICSSLGMVLSSRY